MSFKYLLFVIWILLSCLLIRPARTGAEPTSSGSLTREQEVELATSGAPEYLRADASVFVLTGNKYELAKKGTNGITCIVFRDSADSSEPICYDEEGARSNMKTDIKRSELRKQGISENEIEAKIKEAYQSGELQAPKRSGVAYMLSDRNFIFNPEGKAYHYPPHVMLYAPYLKNSDIGARKEEFGSTSVPWVLSEGTPEAYIIVVPGGEAHQH